MKFKEVKTGSNLAESSKEGFGSKSALLPMVVMTKCTSVSTTDTNCFTNSTQL
jgi:hypothetical protein